MQLPDPGLGELVDNEDYYSLLNASRDASPEELKSCYRRLCMIYHPDKHEQFLRKEASEIFQKIQIAYNVLSDPTKRHIYDIYGKEGLEADWQVIERQKTPLEMREEFEKLQRLKEQHRLEEKTNPKGTFSMTIDATGLFDRFEDDQYYDDALVLPDVAKIQMSQSIEAPLTLSHTATLSGDLVSRNGNGSGNVALSMRSLLSDSSWGELEMAVSDSKHFSFAAKGYKSLGKGLFTLVHIPIRSYLENDMLIIHRPDFNCQIGHVLSQDLFGSLEFGLGETSHISTSLVKEDRRFRLNGKLQLGIPHSFGVCGLIYKLPNSQGNVKVALNAANVLSVNQPSQLTANKLTANVGLMSRAGTFGFMVEYGGEHRISRYSTVAAHVSIGVPLGVTLKLRLNRASHTYMMPILLSDDVNFTAAFYGTFLPVACYAALQFLVIRPYNRRQQRREEAEQEKHLVQETKKKQDEAAALIAMMKQSTDRKIEIEQSKRGLIIVEAWYGSFVQEGSSTDDTSKLIDVRIPLQNLVENSILQLPKDITKSGLPGFYDPCPSRNKELKVIYKFRGGLHQVIIDDRGLLRMPLKSHTIKSNGQ